MSTIAEIGHVSYLYFLLVAPKTRPDGCTDHHCGKQTESLSLDVAEQSELRCLGHKSPARGCLNGVQTEYRQPRGRSSGRQINVWKVAWPDLESGVTSSSAY